MRSGPSDPRRDCARRPALRSHAADSRHGERRKRAAIPVNPGTHASRDFPVGLRPTRKDNSRSDLRPSRAWSPTGLLREAEAP